VTDPSIAGESGGPLAPLAVRGPGYWIVRSTWSPPEQTQVAATYLDETERAALSRLPERARGDRLRGRVAAIDAVRAWLAERGLDGVAPGDVSVRNDASGRPRVRVVGGRGLVGAPSVSVAHRRPVAVAVAGAPGEATGIDVEVVEPRGDVFARLALTAAELRLGRELGVATEAWVTRAWTVKEAVAKAAGTGLRGRPKDFVVLEVDGGWARAMGPDATGGVWVRSHREDDLVISVVARRDRRGDDSYRDA
jgi:phosphopantetheinyl transferase